MLIDAALWRGGRALLLVFLATVLWNGCSPDDFLVADEDRERNFQRARDAERLGDYEAASEYYERALDRNSRSPQVHLGYASLCESALRRYADAVYHYQRYLRLLPNDPKADDIRRRITNCTERLATSVPLVIRSETIARDLAAVRNENISLRAQVTNLTGTIVAFSNEWRRLSLLSAQQQAQIASLSQAAQAQAGANPGAALGHGPSPTPPSGRATTNAPAPPSRTGSPVVAARMHRVQPGETMDRIARQYGIPVSVLQSANPRVNARHMKAGTDLRIPPR